MKLKLKNKFNINIITVITALLCLPISVTASEAGAFFDQLAMPKAISLGNNVGQNPAQIANQPSELGLTAFRAVETDVVVGKVTTSWNTLGFSLGIISSRLDGFSKTAQNATTGRYAPGESFGYQGLGVQAGTGFALSQGLSAGINLNFIQEKVLQYQSTGFRLDAGLLARITPQFSVGAWVKNALEPQLKWTTPSANTEIRTRTWVLGSDLTVIDKILYVNTDAILDDHTLRFQGGLEYWAHPNFALRVGVNSQALSVGTGIQLGTLVLDMAYLMPANADVEPEYRVGLRLTL